MEFGFEKVKELSVLVDVAPNANRILADPLLIKQILLNLLSNARKFTPANGRISVRSARDEQGGVVLAVDDTGVGIPAENLIDIAEPFTRFHEGHLIGSRDRGFGLGLSLVKKFVRLHGATFAIHSTVGRGTTATVTFPSERTANT